MAVLIVCIIRDYTGALPIRKHVELRHKSLLLILSGARYHVHQLAPIASARGDRSVVLTQRQHLRRVRKSCGDDVVIMTFRQLLGQANLSTLITAIGDFRTWKRTLDANADTLRKGRLDYMFVLICLSNVFGTHGDSIDSVHMSAIRSYVFRAIPSEKIFLYQHGLIGGNRNIFTNSAFIATTLLGGSPHHTG